MDDDDEPSVVESIILNEGDRQLVWKAARLLIAQEPGQKREDAAEHLMQEYRDDLAYAHLGVDPETLDEMADNFSGALLVEMERCDDDDGEAETLRSRGATLLHRRRVIAALGQLLAAIDPWH